MRVRIERCDCMRMEWHGALTSGPGMHDGQEGEVVGSTPEGHVLVCTTPGRMACRASTVREVTS